MTTEVAECFAERLSAEIASADKLMFVIAGHNGAGKSTYYQTRLRPLLQSILCGRHIDPDALEREYRAGQTNLVLSPLEWSRQAQVLADEERQSYIDRGASFSFETVFSDPYSHRVTFLQRAIERGYAVVMIFIGLDSPGLSASRVAARVAHGGHDVPLDKIYSRYPRVLSNIQRACGFVHVGLLVDNSMESEGTGGCYREVAVYHRGGLSCESDGVKPAWYGAVCKA